MKSLTMDSKQRDAVEIGVESECSKYIIFEGKFTLIALIHVFSTLNYQGHFKGVGLNHFIHFTHMASHQCQHVFFQKISSSSGRETCFVLSSLI